MWIRLQKLDVWWDRALLKGENSLDQAREPRTTLGVSNVGLDGADVNSPVTKNIPNGTCLNWITYRSAGSMTLNLLV